MRKQDIKAMQIFIDTMVGIPKFSYPAKKNAPRPKNDFAHIQVIEEYQEGIPAMIITDSNRETQTRQYRSAARLRYRIGVVEDDGEASTKIMHGWTHDVIKNLMISLGYGFKSIHPIGLEDAHLERVEWESRQGFTIELYTTRIYDEIVDNITGASIGASYYYPGLAAILTTIEINDD